MKRVRRFSDIPRFLEPWVGKYVGYMVLEFRKSGASLGKTMIPVTVLPEVYTVGPAGNFYPGVAPDHAAMVGAVGHFVPVGEMGGETAEDIANWIEEVASSAAHEGDELYGSAELGSEKPLSKYKAKWHFEFFDWFLKSGDR